MTCAHISRHADHLRHDILISLAIRSMRAEDVLVDLTLAERTRCLGGLRGEAAAVAGGGGPAVKAFREGSELGLADA